LARGFVVSGMFRAPWGQIPSPERKITVGKKGNGEGSIYEHKKNGMKVGYRGPTQSTPLAAQSAATLPVRLGTM
jgi:hypothetical protein